MSRWVRLWEDMPTDPKWRVIARRSSRSVPEVVAVFVLMMTNAEASTGALDGWDDEDAAAALDMDPEAVSAIRRAMEGKVTDGGVLSGWSKRQPKRPDDTSTDRVRAFRERKKADETQVKRDETEPETRCNAPDKNREETDTDSDTETEAAQPVSHVHVQAREAGELLGHLIDAAGLAEPLPPQLEDTGPIAELVAKGYSLRDRILPVIRSRRGKPFTTWGYFVKAIEEAEHRGAGIGKARQATPAAAVWIAEGSAEWAAATKARGKPPLVTYQSGSPGAWVRPEEAQGAAA